MKLIELIKHDALFLRELVFLGTGGDEGAARGVLRLVLAAAREGRFLLADDPVAHGALVAAGEYALVRRARIAKSIATTGLMRDTLAVGWALSADRNPAPTSRPSAPARAPAPRPSTFSTTSTPDATLVGAFAVSEALRPCYVGGGPARFR